VNLATDDITQLLERSQRGDAEASGQLLELIYADLRRIARARLRGERADTLNTTALVHEAWLAMAHRQQASFGDRRHYLAYAGKAMRHILIDRARRRAAGKRQAVPATTSELHADDSFELLAVDEALTRLATLSPRLARLVELRLFAGLSAGEIGNVLGVTERTVERDWLKARALLAQWLGAP
jgi:RNA polymerase sigma factor (TIGR02999 family)